MKNQTLIIKNGMFKTFFVLRKPIESSIVAFKKFYYKLLNILVIFEYPKKNDFILFNFKRFLHLLYI